VIGAACGITATYPPDQDERATRTRIVELQRNLGTAQADKDFVTQLVELNFKYIDLYYEQTQIQARRSFAL
jgi:hypothetical protein